MRRPERRGAEAPATASGTLAEQLVKPDDTVKVGQALAKLETRGGAGSGQRAAGSRALEGVASSLPDFGCRGR